MAGKSTSPIVDAAEEQQEHHGKIRDIASRLYQGDAGLNIVGKRKYSYMVAGLIVVVAIITILVRPFNLGIEFKGGETFNMPASVGTLDQAQAAIANQGVTIASAQRVGGAAGTADSYLIKTAEL